MQDEENYFCSLSGSTASKIPRYDYGMHNRDHFLLQTSAHPQQQQQQQHLRYENHSPPQQQLQHHRRFESQLPQQQLLQHHRRYESHSPQQLLLQQHHHQRYEMLPQEIIHVPTGPIYFQENIDWKSNIVYQAPPPPPSLEHWNPNLTGKVDSILRTYLISLGQLQNKGLLYLFI
jgi:hypothetical protein